MCRAFHRETRTVVSSRIRTVRVVSLSCAMDHSVFPPPPAGADSSRPLVGVAYLVSNLSGLCRTERAKTRLACTWSPMDSPPVGDPRALGPSRISLLRLICTHRSFSTLFNAPGLGARAWSICPVCASHMPFSGLQERATTSTLEPKSGTRGGRFGESMDRVGLACRIDGRGLHDPGNRICRARSPRQASPLSWNLCNNLWTVACRMGVRAVVGITWRGTLCLLSLGSASGQPSIVNWAEHQFSILFPECDVEARDSVRSLLESWVVDPAYINTWPRDALERIPFLSAKGSFQLGRYIAEQGDLIDPLEWGAISLDSAERQALQTFFRVGYPSHDSYHIPPPWQWGIRRSTLGWEPYVLGPGMRWTTWKSASLPPMTVALDAGKDPFLRIHTARHYLAMSPTRGGWGRITYSPGVHLGAGWLDSSPLFAASVLRPTWQWQGMLHGASYWTTSLKIQWPSGMSAEIHHRSSDWGLSAKWLSSPFSPGWILRLPYSNGWMEAGSRGSHQWFRWRGRHAGWAIDRWERGWRGELSGFLTPEIQTWAFVGLTSASPHAFGFRYLPLYDRSTLRWTIGWMGQGGSWGFGTSSLRMTQPGPYVEAHWRPILEGSQRRHKVVLTLKIRPSGVQWSGRYSFQSAQKWG